jgi:hypothetical protein
LLSLVLPSVGESAQFRSLSRRSELNQLRAALVDLPCQGICRGVGNFSENSSTAPNMQRLWAGNQFTNPAIHLTGLGIRGYYQGHVAIHKQQKRGSRMMRTMKKLTACFVLAVPASSCLAADAGIRPSRRRPHRVSR